MLDHPKLVSLLKQAYSAERAASFAYIGHAASVRNLDEKAAIKQIEDDEWDHRREVLAIMQCYDIPVSQFNEMKYYAIGKFISFSCHVIGWFMPFYFAGRLESGNVCEYFRMMHYFEELGITKHHQVLYDMGMKEKEHEAYFLAKLQSHPLLPYFEKFFAWGNDKTFNDVDLDEKYSVQESTKYCRNH